MLASLGPKEAKKAFLDFYHSFLDKTAVRDTFEGPWSPHFLVLGRLCASLALPPLRPSFPAGTWAAVL